MTFLDVLEQVGDFQPLEFVVLRLQLLKRDGGVASGVKALDEGRDFRFHGVHLAVAQDRRVNAVRAVSPRQARVGRRVGLNSGGGPIPMYRV